MQDHNAQPTAIEDVAALSDDELRRRISMSFLDGNDPHRLAAYRAERDGRARRGFISGLRDLADFLAAHPEVPCDDRVGNEIGPKYMQADEITPEQFVAAVDALGATVIEPKHDSTRIEAHRRFGAITFVMGCKKTVIGERREVSRTEYVMPDALRQRMGDATTKRLRSAA
ncbi:MAG TPA: hypothetical protein VFT50_11590 [Baekduia sp.]|nr:hypothetical protein [Baekduia sp.]